MTADELDDLTYDDLMSQALTLIPRLLPTWTDHNPADPGITLVELFAALAESTGFTIARYVGGTPGPFARLLDESPQAGEQATVTLSRAVRQLSAVRRVVTADDLEAAALNGVMILDLAPTSVRRAGTLARFESVGAPFTRLAEDSHVDDTSVLVAAPAPRPGEGVVVQSPNGQAGERLTVESVSPEGGQLRVHAAAPLRAAHPAGSLVSPTSLATGASSLSRTAAVGERILTVVPADLPERFVVLLGEPPGGEALCGRRLARVRPVVDTATENRVVNVLVVPPSVDETGLNLDQRLYELLRQLVVATTRIRVLRPRYVPLDLDVTVVRQPYGLERTDALRRSVAAALTSYLDPVRGGRDGTGWEFGAPVYRSALNHLLESLPGVDHVYRLAIQGDPQIEAWALDADRAQAARSLVRVGRLSVTALDAAEGW